MSNKTSDNVANIERLNNFANMTFLYGNRVNLNVSGLKEVQNDIKNILSDYTRQKQINEEHKKINGELRQAINTVEKEKGEWIEECQQKDKRIQELEKERDHWHGCFIVAMENSIAKEKVKDKIEEVHNMKFKDDRLNGATIDFVVHKFQELLEGESK